MQTRLLRKADLTAISKSQITMSASSKWNKLADEAFRLMTQLIAGDIYIWNELSENGELLASTTFPILDQKHWDTMIPPLTRFLHEHPFVSRLMSEKPQNFIASISELKPTRSFTETNLYQKAYKLFAGRHQISSSVKTGYGTYLILSVNRQDKDFTQREKAILGKINQQALVCHLNIQRTDLLAAKIFALQNSNTPNCGVFLYLDHKYTILSFSPGAHEKLREQFGESADSISIPQTLIDHLNRYVEKEPFSDCIKFNFFHSRTSFNGRLEKQGSYVKKLYLEEFNKPSIIRKCADELAQLTSRQKEAIRWAIDGKTNNEIGNILNLSPRTVEKHLHTSYEKLGIKNRTQLTRKILRNG